MDGRMASSRRGGMCACLVLAALIAVAPSASAQSEPDPERFQKVVLEDTGLVQPMRLAVADDGRVLYIQRDGRLHVWDPDTQDSVVAGTLPTTVAGETGLIGLTLANGFATTGHIYLNRALPGFSDSTSPNFRQQRVSRYTLSDGNVLDLASEVPIIQTTNRGGGGHSGGDLEMTPDGLLYITTGDNTGCCASFGFAPHDERPGRETNDAQRTSGNTNDLNGKLMRIRPLPEGGYAIPAGNLFTGNEEGGGKTRPEIYAMGFRNLFSIGGYDEATNAPWIADYGPDAVLDGERGPRGFVRGMLVTEAANYGWPYCTANLIPYTDWDYVNNVGRGPFSCANPVNDSPNNTGLVNLPPIKAANVYYSYTSGEPWPMLYGGGLHALDRYDFDPANPSTTKFPEWFDDRFFFSEFTANYVGSLRFAADKATPEDVGLHFPTMQFGSPFDARFGPDGSLYMIEFGSNNFSSTKTTPAIYRIDYVSGNRVPLVKTSASTDSGPAPLAVQFDASETTDPDGDDLTFAWDFTNDGTVDATGPTVSHTFTVLGEHTTRVTVTDENGGSAIGNIRTVVGNTRPVVEFITPIDGGFHEFTAGPIAYKLKVTDPEDGAAVDCTKVQVELSLGHDRHQHPTATSTPNAACEGSVTPSTDGSHGGTAYLYHAITASYVDSGGAANVPSLTGQASVILHPRTYAARHTQDSFGVIAAGATYNMSVSGAYLMYPHINLADVDRVNVEISGQTGSVGGNWTLRAGSPTGPVVARHENLPNTGTTYWGVGGDARFVWLTDDIDDPGGVNDLYVVVDYPPGTTPGRIALRNMQFVTAPESVTATVNPATPDGANGWYKANPTITVSTAGMPLWTRQTSIDSGATWQNTNAQGVATISANGTITVLYRAVDSAGVVAPGGSLSLKIDTVAPVTTATINPAAPGASGWYDAPPEIALAATDATSGVARSEYSVDGGDWQTYGGPFRVSGYGEHVVSYRSVDLAGNTEVSRDIVFRIAQASQNTDVSGTVPGTLNLSVTPAASFGSFVPGVARDYDTTLAANVTSTGGNAALTVSDTGANQGHLVNGSFVMPRALQARAGSSAFAPLGGSPLTLQSWAGPVSNEAVTIGLRQPVAANDALRTGTYSKTLTFTLSTTAP